MPTVKEQVDALNKGIEEQQRKDRKHLYISAIRALAALKPQTNPQTIDVSRLNRDNLKALALKIHDCFVHYTGNCGVLSAAFLFNLKAGKLLLRVDNLYPTPYGLHPLSTNKLLFSSKGNYQTFEKVNSVQALEERLLAHYQQTKERFYRVNTSHHQFNAVILIENGKPLVQFVDLWKTSNPVPTIEEFAKNCTPHEFCIELMHGSIDFDGVMATLHNKGVLKTDFDLETFKKAFPLQSKDRFFKSPLNFESSKLERFKSREDVLHYAAAHPKSQTTKVLKSLGAISTETPFKM